MPKSAFTKVGDRQNRLAMILRGVFDCAKLAPDCVIIVLQKDCSEGGVLKLETKNTRTFDNFECRGIRKNPLANPAIEK